MENAIPIAAAKALRPVRKLRHGGSPTRRNQGANNPGAPLNFRQLDAVLQAGGDQGVAEQAGDGHPADAAGGRGEPELL